MTEGEERAFWQGVCAGLAVSLEDVVIPFAEGLGEEGQDALTTACGTVAALRRHAKEAK